MWVRYKRILQAAAVLVLAGGGTVATALVAANQADVEPVTCAEFGRAVQQNTRPLVVYYLRPEGVPVPGVFEVGGEAFALGDCTDTPPRGCVLRRADCDRKYAIRWAYRIGPGRGGKELVEAIAPPYFVRALKAYSQSTEGYTWLGVFKTARSLCAPGEGQGPCFRLLNDLNPAWALAAEPGYICRETDPLTRAGKKYGPGVGGNQPCTVSLTDTPFPFSDKGRGQAWADGASTADLPADGALDWPR